MLTMSTDRWLFLLALCFICVSSNDEEYFEHSCEEYSDFERHTLSAPLGSSVLLPCNFLTSGHQRVLWAQTPVTELVRLTSEGRVQFLDHRFGRVKAFPNQGSVGNYSIRIDDLKNSDLGWYRCRQGKHCFLMELAAETGALSEEVMLLIYICVGGAAFILLSVGGYCCMNYMLCCKNRAQENINNPAGAGIEGASAPPVETFSVPVGGQLRGADNLVYENDDQDPTNQWGGLPRSHCSVPGVLPDLDMTQPPQSIYPNLNQFNFERAESRRTKQRFHTDLLSRLRQASFGRHYYVNQSELRSQQATSTQAENRSRGGLGKKKGKENCEYKNPIYNRSTDQLNHL